jgi:hypothetical protein
VSDNPKRFGFFAVLPLPDVEGALRESEYALDTLKADGIGVLSSYEGKYLGNPAFAPLMDEWHKRKTVVYCHPFCAACAVQQTLTDAQNRGVEFVFDTTRTILSLLQTATVARCPDIKFIWSHGGGTVPYITSRLNGVGGNKLPKGVQSVHTAVVQEVRADIADRIRDRLSAGGRIRRDRGQGPHRQRRIHERGTEGDRPGQRPAAAAPAQRLITSWSSRRPTRDSRPSRRSLRVPSRVASRSRTWPSTAWPAPWGRPS